MLFFVIFLIGAVVLLVFGYWILEYMAILKDIEPIHSEYTKKYTHSEPDQTKLTATDTLKTQKIA